MTNAKERERDRRLRELYSRLQRMQKQLRSTTDPDTRAFIEEELQKVSDEIDALISGKPDDPLP